MGTTTFSGPVQSGDRVNSRGVVQLARTFAVRETGAASIVLAAAIPKNSILLDWFMDGIATWADASATVALTGEPSRGVPSAVTVTARGADYVPATTLASIASTTGSGAVLTPVVNADGGIDSITSAGGENYSPDDAVVISDIGGGSGAAAVLTVGGVPYMPATAVPAAGVRTGPTAITTPVNSGDDIDLQVIVTSAAPPAPAAATGLSIVTLRYIQVTPEVSDAIDAATAAAATRAAAAAAAAATPAAAAAPAAAPAA